MKPQQNKELILNKKASFSYTILDKFIAGIALYGSEVKSLRNHQANLRGAHCYFRDNELWLSGMHISPYAPASHDNHLPTRPRKLLLKKRELRKIQKKKQEKTWTLIPLRILLTPKNLLKVEIALCQGKKKYDKRAAIKERDIQRTLAKKIKHSPQKA